LELQSSKVTVNDFMDVMMSDPGPHCLVWLPLLYRLGSVEQGKSSIDSQPAGAFLKRLSPKSYKLSAIIQLGEKSFFFLLLRSLRVGLVCYTKLRVASG
jgi:EF-hand